MITLNIPGSNGTGAASDASALDPDKTFVVGGTLAPGESLVVEGTADPAGAQGWNGVAVFTSAMPVRQVVAAVVKWLRVRRASGTTSSGAPTCTVDATALAAQTFQALAVPTGSGSGAATDVSAQGATLQATLSGTMRPGESLLVEGSQNGASWDTVLAFTNAYPGPQVALSARYAFARVTRAGVVPGTAAPAVFLGTSKAGTGGGGGGGGVTLLDAGIPYYTPLALATTMAPVEGSVFPRIVRQTAYDFSRFGTAAVNLFCAVTVRRTAGSGLYLIAGLFVVPDGPVVPATLFDTVAPALTVSCQDSVALGVFKTYTASQSDFPTPVGLKQVVLAFTQGSTGSEIVDPVTYEVRAGLAQGQ